MKFKYDVQTLQWMSLFEKVTKAKLKDFFMHQDKLCFLVQPGNLRKALGQNKSNLKKLEDLLKKRIKIIEYSDDELKFIANVMAPLKIVEIKKDEEGIVTITGPDQKTKGLMIGAQARNLRLYESVVQKYFPEIKELKVI